MRDLVDTETAYAPNWGEGSDPVYREHSTPHNNESA